jgi:hypothetical protein
MLGRLGRRLNLLTGGERDLPERQRTLRDAIEWSHTLLDEGEKTLLYRMAVFSGSRTLEAIEAVCDAQGDLPVDAFEGVSALLDKSPLRQEEGPEGEPRLCPGGRGGASLAWRRAAPTPPAKESTHGINRARRLPTSSEVR